MSKRNQSSPQAGKHNGLDVSNTDITVSLDDQKNLPRWKTVDIKLVELQEGKVQLYLIGDGEPYAFWTDAYQNLEIAKTHASQLRKRLREGVHIVKCSISELKQFYPRVHAACTQKYISSFYYFLTEEGFNRTVLEVNTSGMKNREVAAKIDLRKDEIAKVYTEFKKGKLISANPILSNINPERLESDYKSRTITNIARVKMLQYQLRKQKPNNPDTVNRTNKTFRHDYEACVSPLNGENLPKYWRKKLDEQSERALHIKEIMEFGEHMHGNIDQERVNTNVLKYFKEVFPEYMPKNLNNLLSKTRQTYLIGGD